ncbi:hypothetical protein HK104_002148 [Borealophlyctis nickersoniae]|nr:hypothetical protein HK104_002148 [Borealophlyctis nickersoniae]
MPVVVGATVGVVLVVAIAAGAMLLWRRQRRQAKMYDSTAAVVPEYVREVQPEDDATPTEMSNPHTSTPPPTQPPPTFNTDAKYKMEKYHKSLAEERAWLVAQIAERDAELARLDAVSAEMDARLAEQDAEIERLEKELMEHDEWLELGTLKRMARGLKSW